MKKVKRFTRILLPLVAIVMLLSLTACGKKLQSIEITQMPTKTSYIAGESFDPTGMEVSAVYSDGSKEKITDFKVDKTNLAYGDTKVKVTYDDKNADVNVTVKDFSVYEITGEVQSTAKPNTDYEVNATLRAKEARGIGYEKVLIYAEIEKPQGGSVTLKATDTEGQEWDVAQIGVWGPPSGFAIAHDYNVATKFKVNFSKEGTYKIKISVYTLNASNAKDKLIAEKEFTVNVTNDAQQ